MKQANITIIGLGLIGGSLAKALHEKLGCCNITAIDTDESALELAMAEGTIARGLLYADGGIHRSELIFICTPVKNACCYIKELAEHVPETCIITDVCSTKGEIVNFVEALPNPPCFIGGHPMAGTEKSGYVNSMAHLFENAYYVLTPISTTSQNALDTLTAIVKGIGTIPIVMSADEHDRAAAGISHLPHIVASALVNLIKQMDSGSGKMALLAAGGFRDITRIASSSPVLWEHIVKSNKVQIEKLLSIFAESLKSFADSLKNDESEEIYRFFADAGQFRDSISTRSAGLLPPLCRLIVDVQDKPGIIGEITTILGRNNINIKNINVTNSREFEQGCLIISLSDTTSENIAFDLLVNTGYKVYKTR